MAELNSERELKNALQQIEKQFGKGAIMQLGAAPPWMCRASPPGP